MSGWGSLSRSRITAIGGSILVVISTALLATLVMAGTALAAPPPSYSILCHYPEGTRTAVY